MIDWKVGDKVVCVDISEGRKYTRHLEVNKIYTIIHIGDAWDLRDKKNVLCVSLKEFGGKIPFPIRHFRPLINKKSTTEFFEKLCLEAVKTKELVKD